jgi:hypothetical protein
MSRQPLHPLRVPSLGPCLALAAVLLLGAGAVRADAYDYVLVPYNEAGKFNLRLAWGVADKREISASGQALALGYSPSALWYTELWVAQERDRGRPLAYPGWYWSNQLHLASTERSDWALYISYWRPPASAGGWEWTLAPMWQYAARGFDLNVNILAKHWLRPSRPQSTELGYQAQIKSLLQPGVEWGAQAYGELGPLSNPEPWKEQQHQFGPALFGHQASGGGVWRYDAALLAGLNKASPRAQLRAQLAYQF